MYDKFENFKNLGKFSLLLKKPDKTRRSFSILKRTQDINGDYKTEKICLKAIDLVNQGYREGKYSFETSNSLMDEIVKTLYLERDKNQPAETKLNPSNQKILEDYWKAEYEHRDIIAFVSCRNDLKRAIRAIGDLSLVSASKEELQRHIAIGLKNNRQRKVVSRINSLLRFIGRPIKLRKDRPSQNHVAHLTFPEFKQVALHILDDDVRLLAEVAFATGCRLGELFAITENVIQQRHVLVNSQIDRYNVRRGTKTRKIRKAFILPQYRDRVLKWARLGTKLEKRHLRYSSIIRRACKKAFPDDSSKWITFHDLRHSHAIHLLSRGVSLSLVSLSIGNSVAVCQQYYVGFVLTDEGIETITRQLSAFSETESTPRQN